MPARILAIDTTSDFASLALCEDATTVREILLHSSDGFAHILFDHIQRLLHDHNWPLASIDCFAASSGPGSFTGVRVGLAAAKGLADVLSKPIVPVSNLLALSTFGSLPLRAPVIDARRGEIYGAVYDDTGQLVQPEVVTPFPHWRDHLPPAVEFLSQTPSLFAPHTPSGSQWTECPRALAAAIGRLAARSLHAGTALDPLSADANYVRRTDAELFWKE